MGSGFSERLIFSNEVRVIGADTLYQHWAPPHQCGAQRQESGWSGAGLKSSHLGSRDRITASSRPARAIACQGMCQKVPEGAGEMAL